MKSKTLTNRTQRRTGRGQKGSFMVEFAMVGWTLFFLMAGVTQIGLNLSRAMTAASVCHDANVLAVRGIDLSQSINQQLVMRSSAGLGINTPGSWTPSATGSGVVYLSQVMLVGPLECGIGVSNFDGTNATCPNLNKYVITMRIAIGNKTNWSSAVGTPTSTPGANGFLTDNDICTQPGNVTTAFPTDLSLAADQFAHISEVFADTSNIQFFSFLTPSAIYMRNLS